MTPEQIAAIGAVSKILETLGGMPVTTLLFLALIGPWVGLVAVTLLQSRQRRAELERMDQSIAAQNARAEAAIAAQNERINQALLERNEQRSTVLMDFKDQMQAAAVAQEKRFEAVVRMYESNVDLVRQYHRTSEDVAGFMSLATRSLEGLVVRVEHNLFCPLLRSKKTTGADRDVAAGVMPA
jgi:hypothetical protein